jgi:DNA-binding NtrC family response regulator
MRRVYDQLLAYAHTRETVLLLGESGTGKNLAAEAIHHLSGRQGPFRAINCAGITETLLESELFGHEAGAFTGATSRRIGWFEAAAGGTLFLDEIGELAPASQAKLLHVVERHEIVRVGGREPIRVDVRLVAATNRNLREEAGGSFRLDLYHRLSALEIRMPALRERLDDLPVLVPHLLAIVCEELARPGTTVSAAALERLAAYDWPGNVRELQHVLTKARLLATGVTIGADDVAAGLATAPAAAGAPRRLVTLAEAVTRAERDAILGALAVFPQFGDAARALDIDVKTLFVKRRDLFGS